MNKTIVIDCDEQGQYSVGELQSGVDMSEEGSIETPPAPQNMQPTESLDAALDMARSMFSEDPNAAENQGAFEKGFKNANQAAGLDQYIKRG